MPKKEPGTGLIGDNGGGGGGGGRGGLKGPNGLFFDGRCLIYIFFKHAMSKCTIVNGLYFDW